MISLKEKPKEDVDVEIENWAEKSRAVKILRDEAEEIKVELANKIGEIASSNEIDNLKELLEEKKKEINTAINDIIGNMYNGVLIKERLSIRNGRLHRYKHQYNSLVENFQEELKADKNKAELISKLGQDNYDLMIMILPLLKSIRGYNNITDLDIEPKEIKLNPFISIEARNNELTEVETIVVDENGIKFCDNAQDIIYLDNETRTIMSYYYRNSIKENVDKIILLYKQEIEKIQKDIDFVKDKGSRFLMLAKIKYGDKEKDTYY